MNIKNLISVSTVRNFFTLVLLGYLSVSIASDNPSAAIENNTQLVFAKIKENVDVYKDNKKELFDLIENEVLPYFDFRRMSAYAIGRKHWRASSQEQRRDFTEEFKKLLVLTYGTAVLQYTEFKLDFLPPTSQSKKHMTVRGQIKRNDATTQPVPINLKIYKNKASEWRVYDVIIGPASLILNQRKSFDAEIQKNGLDGLITRLKKHNAEKMPS